MLTPYQANVKFMLTAIEARKMFDQVIANVQYEKFKSF